MSDILTAHNLRIVRDGQTLIQDMSFSLQAGKITMLLGHNGAGKTVLTRALHGLIDCDNGSVTAPPHAEQKMVFQKPILLRRTVREHFDYVCPGQSRDQAMAWLDTAGIADLANRNCHTLSGGEQQKLALIGALAAEPKLLFLDEPSAHLDIDATIFIEDMIIKARDAGMTILMISHSRSQAERLAEHVLFLNKGRLVTSCSAADFFTTPQNEIISQFLAHL